MTPSKLFKIDTGDSAYKKYTEDFEEYLNTPFDEYRFFEIKPLLSLLPDMVFDRFLTDAEKIDLLMEGACHFTDNTFLIINREEGTLECLSTQKDIDYPSRLIELEDCKFMYGLRNVACGTFELSKDLRAEILEYKQSGSNSLPMPDKIYNGIPDVIEGYALNDYDKEKLLFQQRLPIGTHQYIQLSMLTGMLRLVSEFPPSDVRKQQAHMITENKCIYHGTKERKVLMPSTDLYEPNAVLHPALLHLSHKQSGSTNKFALIYNINEYLHTIPDRIHGHTLNHIQRAMLFLNGTIQISSTCELELDTIRNLLLYNTRVNDSTNKWIKTPVIASECLYLTNLPAKQESSIYRFPVENAAFTAILNWHRQFQSDGLSNHPIHQINDYIQLHYRQFQAAVNELPSQINNINVGPVDRLDLLLGNEISIGAEIFRLEIHTGLLLAQMSDHDSHAYRNPSYRLLTKGECRFSIQHDKKILTKKNLLRKKCTNKEKGPEL
jgi:hypothetical protein